MSTALATLPDMSTAIGQAEHYRSVRARLGAVVVPPTMFRRKAPPKTRDFMFVQIDIMDSPAATRRQWRKIVHEVCSKHEIGLLDIMGPHRARNITAARHEAMYRLRHETTLSYPEIGARMGGRDHTTIIYGVRKHAERMARR